jgi:hypothetical protein
MVGRVNFWKEENDPNELYMADRFERRIMRNRLIFTVVVVVVIIVIIAPYIQIP